MNSQLFFNALSSWISILLLPDYSLSNSKWALYLTRGVVSELIASRRTRKKSGVATVRRQAAPFYHSAFYTSITTVNMWRYERMVFEPECPPFSRRPAAYQRTSRLKTGKFTLLHDKKPLQKMLTFLTVANSSCGTWPQFSCMIRTAWVGENKQHTQQARIHTRSELWKLSIKNGGFSVIKVPEKKHAAGWPVSIIYRQNEQ